MAHITLIRSPTVVPRWAITAPTCPPIGMAYLASSLLQAGHEVAVIDSIGEAVFQMQPFTGTSLLVHGLSMDQIVERVNPQTDFLGISCMFSNEWPVARELIKKLRQRFPNKPIIGGGEHFTALPEWTLNASPEIDYCVAGEGEEKLIELIHLLSDGKSPNGISGIYFRGSKQPMVREGPIALDLLEDRIKNVDALPPPAWELFPLDPYLDHELGFGVNRGRSMPMLATRGCPYQCTFCSSPQMWTTKWIARDPVKVLDEMESYLHRYRIENFDFYDLTAIVKKEWIISFCKLILKRGLKFTWQLPSGTRSEAIDSEVTRLLYQSGCRNLSYAPESGSPRILKTIKKMVRLDKMKESMRACVKNGLIVKCNIIIGFPGETHADVWKTMKFLVEMAVIGVEGISIQPYSPYPGSELFDGLKKSGKISEFTDEYFIALSSYSDLTKAVSWSENMSSRTLAFYRMVGMSLFFLVSYMVRPWRIVQTLCNVFKKHQETRLEMTIRDTMIRLFSERKTLQNSPSSELRNLSH